MEKLDKILQCVELALRTQFRPMQLECPLSFAYFYSVVMFKLEDCDNNDEE